MRTPTLVTVAIIAVLLGLWGVSAIARRPVAAERPGSPGAGAEVDERDREIAELRRRLAAVEAAQRANGKSPPPEPAAASGQAQPAPGDARDPEILKREAEVAAWMEDHYTSEVQANVFGMYFADVDRVRLAERADETFRGAVERGLHELLANAEPSVGKAKVLRLECGSTLCRIKIEVGKPSERGRLVHFIQQALQLEEASVHMPTEGATLEGVFARAGTSLPQFDQLKYVGAEMSRLGTGTRP